MGSTIKQGITFRGRTLTLFGKAVLLIAAELGFNAICWVAAGICLSQADGLIGLALLAWVSMGSEYKS
jgi:high-affinity nickel-transport protein